MPAAADIDHLICAVDLCLLHVASRMGIIRIRLTDVRLDFAAAALCIEHQDGSLQCIVIDILRNLKFIGASRRRGTDEVCTRLIEIREVAGYDIAAGTCAGIRRCKLAFVNDIKCLCIDNLECLTHRTIDKYCLRVFRLIACLVDRNRIQGRSVIDFFCLRAVEDHECDIVDIDVMCVLDGAVVTYVKAESRGRIALFLHDEFLRNMCPGSAEFHMLFAGIRMVVTAVKLESPLIRSRCVALDIKVELILRVLHQRYAIEIQLAGIFL